MGTTKNQFTRLRIVFMRFPIWKKIVAGLIVLFTIVLVISNFLFAISNVFINGPKILLRDFMSTDRAYQIKIPNGWRYDENLEGIRGNPNLILQAIEGSLFQPTFEIVRIQTRMASLQQIINLDKDQASQFPNVVINSMTPLNTPLYSGTLIVYTIPDAGYRKRMTECHDWIMYNDPYGYIIRLCGISKDWERLGNSYRQIIESFTLNNE